MIFTSYILNDDWTHQVTADKGEVIEHEKRDYTHAEITSIAKSAVKVDHRQYGFDLLYTVDGHNLELFVRNFDGEKVNHTTAGMKSVFEWIDYLYGMADEQTSLF
jgi:hypothetical protein